MRLLGRAQIQYNWWPRKEEIWMQMCLHTGRMSHEHEDSHLQGNERGLEQTLPLRALRRNQPRQHLDLGLLTSRTVTQ